MECTNDCFLTQVVKEVTKGDTLLHFVLTKKKELVEDVKFWEAFSQWFPVKEETMSTNCNMRNSTFCFLFFFCCGDGQTLGSFPESLYNLHRGRNTKSNWTELGATCC